MKHETALNQGNIASTPFFLYSNLIYRFPTCVGFALAYHSCRNGSAHEWLFEIIIPAKAILMAVYKFGQICA
jgi:hypothetical protein